MTGLSGLAGALGARPAKRCPGTARTLRC